MKQLSLIPITPSRKSFGGSRLNSHPKTARPLSTKNPIHLVLKSEIAKGSQSFLKGSHAPKIDGIIRKQANTSGIRLYHFVNVGNHLHLVIKTPNRRAYNRFIRATTGLIARLLLRKERGPEREQKTHRRSTGAFWVARPFTRIASWGREYLFLKSYMVKNRIQALDGFFDARIFNETTLNTS
jgi:REP element-mobilizing transposase RayT